MLRKRVREMNAYEKECAGPGDRWGHSRKVGKYEKDGINLRSRNIQALSQ
jgi:hypothetical protein